MEVDHAADRDHARRRCHREYLLALEEERRKIQVFQRELPLCFELVTQTIQGMRSQLDGAGSEETVSDQGSPPVLEEFIPLKPSLSLSSSEEESTHAKPGKEEAETSERHSSPPPPPTPPEAKKATPDWLQSVQLWSQEPLQPSSPSPTPAKELPCKPVALNARMAGGAFHPFEKEKRAELPASSTTAAATASSTVVADSGDKPTDDTEMNTKDVKDKDKEGQSQPHRKPRRCWAPELHRRFLQALQQLGGSHVATPKQIRELMKVDGLTNDEVKSHLQKYRLHTRRPSSAGGQSSTAAATAAPPAPQFVVVGGIWVPPPEYAAAAAQQQVQLAAADASGSANPVYAPVAMLAPGLQPHSHRRQQQQQSQTHSGDGSPDGRRRGDAGNGSSSSPAVSSSSQTTSA